MFWCLVICLGVGSYVGGSNHMLEVKFYAERVKTYVGRSDHIFGGLNHMLGGQIICSGVN